MAINHKLGPPYLQKQLRECAAFHALTKMYELHPMKQADQYNFLFLNYHSLAPAKVFTVHLILAGEEHYADLWQKTTRPMKLSIRLPGNLASSNGA